MKIELNKEDMELVMTGLAYAKLEAINTLDRISNLEDKILKVTSNQNCGEEVTDCEEECTDCEEECTESNKTFFYNTFNFEVEQDNYSYEIIKPGEHLRLINGKQGQLGIESGVRGRTPYKPLFISQEDKMLFLKIFQLISNGLEAGMNTQDIISELSNIYVYAKPKYSVHITYNKSCVGKYDIKLITDENDVKYNISVDMSALDPAFLIISKNDGTNACIGCGAQLLILIDFIIYHL